MTGSSSSTVRSTTFSCLPLFMLAFVCILIFISGQPAAAVPILIPGAHFYASTYSGPVPLAVQFTDTSTSWEGNTPITSYYWDFGDGTNSTVQNPPHTFTQTGDYTVTETVTDSNFQTSSTTATITVLPPTSPVAGFTANVTSGPVLLAVQFTDDSTAGSLAPITSYYWDFGDGTNSTLQNPTHTFTQIGQYTVNETVTDGNFETSSYNATITVLPPIPPVTGFTANVTSGITPLAVQFTDNSTAGSAPVTSYSWNFGDGTNSTLQNPTHSFTQLGSNVVTETVTDSNFQNSSYTETISVLPVPPNPPAPQSIWAMDRPQDYTPATCTFYDWSSGDIVNWYWNFGDGATSTERNPTHTYGDTSKGLHYYVVYETVTDSLGRTSTSSQSFDFWGIDPNAPVADFTATKISGHSSAGQ